MTTATVVMERTKPSIANVVTVEREQTLATEAPEISRAAWKVITFLLVGAVLLLAVLGGYVIAGMYRFQNCL
jgi:hypothetical protein